MPAPDAVSPQIIHALYRDHQDWLRGWLRRKLGCSHMAADLAHDTWVRLMTSGRLPGPEQSRSYLAQIARNLVIDHWRRQDVERAYLQALAALPEPEAPSEEARWLILEALYRIEAMLRELPPLTREIFLLAQMDGLRYQQIADRLGVSLPTVKRHMSKALVACMAER